MHGRGGSIVEESRAFFYSVREIRATQDSFEGVRQGQVVYMRLAPHWYAYAGQPD